jgi:hypothetical protein
LLHRLPPWVVRESGVDQAGGSSNVATAGAYESAVGSSPTIVRWFMSWCRERSLTAKSKNVRVQPHRQG